MTVQTTTSVATGIGNDVTTVFPFNFKLTSETDLVVLDVTTADETYTELTLGSDYTVQGVGSENGGSITLAVPLPSGHEVKMARELDILQQTDLRNQGKFFAETHEDVFDRLVMILQQLQNGIDRSVKVPVTSNTPADQLFQEFKQDVADAESAAEASEAARDESQQIANKFGDVDGAVSATEALRDEAAASEAVATAKALEAEIAAAAALGSGNVYANTAIGLANTINGQIFLQDTADPQTFNVFRNSGGTDAIPSGTFSVRPKDQTVGWADMQPDFPFRSVISTGDLNSERWGAGSYIVATGVLNRPPGIGTGNAAMTVTPFGRWDLVTISLMSEPSSIFQRIVRFDTSEFGGWQEIGGAATIPDGSLVRSKLAPQFSYNSLISAGSLEDQRWPEGGYLVASAVDGRPAGMAGGNAAMTVTPVGLWDLVTITLVADPAQSFRRIVRFDTADFGTWIPVGGGSGGTVPDGAVTREKLAATYSYNTLISSGSMDSAFDEGSYLIGSSVTERPAGMPGGNLHLVVEPAGAWFIQRATLIQDPRYRFMRVVRPNQSSYPAWQPSGAMVGGSVNRLLGKKVVFLGDSITDSYGMPERVRDLLGANVINCGIGGTRMGVHTTGGYSGLSGWKIAESIESGDFSPVIAAANTVGTATAINRAAQLAAVDWSTVEYIVVGYGTNDFGGDRQIGTIDDTDETTFYGATNLVISQIQAAYPAIRLLFWTPIWRRRTPTATGGIAGGSDVSPNNHGLFLYQFGEALQAMCKRHHLECLELYYTSGISEATYSQYLVDELHPTPAGSDLLAAKIASGLTSRW